MSSNFDENIKKEKNQWSLRAASNSLLRSRGCPPHRRRTVLAVVAPVEKKCSLAIPEFYGVSTCDCSLYLGSRCTNCGNISLYFYQLPCKPSPCLASEL